MLGVVFGLSMVAEIAERLTRMIRITVLIGLFCVLSIANAADQVIKIGVRAHSGEAQAMEKWQPTADYLSTRIAGYRFQVVPYVDLNALTIAAQNAELDFVLTNPSSYVEMELRAKASALATLLNKRQGDPYSRFGSVIFTLADSEINSFEDLVGKRFMAVAAQAFGGWRVAWYELLQNGIDPLRDFAALEFGDGIQERVIEAVAARRIDAGVVRTDMLERVAAEGRIDLRDFRPIGVKQSVDFPFMHSTALYPEWAFARLQNTPGELARQVTVALLSIAGTHSAAIAGRYAGWTVPANYASVHALLKYLNVGPYAGQDKVSLKQVFEQYWPVIVLSLTLFFFVTFAAVLVIRTNRRESQARVLLESEVAERRQAEEALREYHDRLEVMVSERTEALEASNRELESYSYSIAHDLRTPLRSVTSFAQILDEELDESLTEEQRDYLRRVIGAGKYMGELIDDILDLSRIARTELHKTPVNLSVIARNVLNVLQSHQPERSVDIAIEPHLCVTGDPNLVRVLMENLLDNAWKYTANVAEARIAVGAECRNDETVFYVKDNGEGFDVRYADQIFKPFHRLHRLGEYEGTGVGLATVQRIVQRHNGKVWAVGKRKQGACIYFAFASEMDSSVKRSLGHTA